MKPPLIPRLVGAARALQLLLGGRLRNPGAIVFGYHDVSTDPGNTTDYVVSPAQLHDHLQLAMQWGLRFVDLADVVDRLAQGRAVDGLAAVAFDDSLSGVHHNAVAVLQELQVPATVFAVSGALGLSPPWWRGAARVMTAKEVSEVSRAGVRVESHTRSHPALPGLGRSRLRSELVDSRKELEDLTGSRTTLLAYPFGRSDPEVRDEVLEAGYRAGFSFRNGRIIAGVDPLSLPRLNMHSGQRRPRLAYHLARPSSSW